jgi:hypothetical protein
MINEDKLGIAITLSMANMQVPIISSMRVNPLKIDSLVFILLIVSWFVECARLHKGDIDIKIPFFSYAQII